MLTVSFSWRPWQVMGSELEPSDCFRSVILVRSFLRPQGFATELTEPRPHRFLTHVTGKKYAYGRR
jgi:hypothetical protein